MSKNNGGELMRPVTWIGWKDLPASDMAPVFAPRRDAGEYAKTKLSIVKFTLNNFSIVGKIIILRSQKNFLSHQNIRSYYRTVLKDT